MITNNYKTTEEARREWGELPDTSEMMRLHMLLDSVGVGYVAKNGKWFESDGRPCGCTTTSLNADFKYAFSCYVTFARDGRSLLTLGVAAWKGLFAELTAEQVMGKLLELGVYGEEEG